MVAFLEKRFTGEIIPADNAHTTLPPKLSIPQQIEHMKKKWPGFEPTVELGQIGATIGVHTGPHPIGFGLCEKSC